MSEGPRWTLSDPRPVRSWLRRSARRVLTGASVVMKKGRSAVARHTRWKLLLSALRSTQQSRASGRDLLRRLFNFKSRPHRLRHCNSKLLEISRYLGDGSNQTAELHAMRESFILARPGDTIFSDPRYAVMLITGHWHPKAHRDLISEIKKISCAWGSQQVDCWTHQARWQERADKLAKRAALKCLSFETFFLRVSLMRPRTIDLRGRRPQQRSTVCWANACEPTGN